jgi:hypothetical protein
VPGALAAEEAAHDDFATIRAMLETMPLPTDQFGLACTRLKNALRWGDGREGAVARKGGIPV